MSLNFAEGELHEVPTEDVLLIGEENLSPDEIARRQTLAHAILEKVPVEALETLQIFQPAIGCLNQCNFCSQEAGAVARELDADSLRTVMGGVRGAMRGHGLESVGGKRMHKSEVIFPYLDNDIGSYRGLDTFLTGIRSLGARARISTVGWSRHSEDLQTMHESIAEGHIDDYDGIRFSLTPYTYGWRAGHDEYVQDFGNALRTYKPLLDEKGPSRRTACVEMRFKPDIALEPVRTEKIGKYTIVGTDEYALISEADLVNDETTHVAEMKQGVPVLSRDGALSINAIGNIRELTEETIGRLFDETDENKATVFADAQVLASKGSGYKFANADGEYYCFEPIKGEDSTFRGVHYYPATDKRPASGVLDATRPLLNSLVGYKRELGYDARDEVADANEKDIQQVRERIANEAALMEQFSPRRAAYIREQILPLVDDAIQALDIAGLDPSYFLTYGFLVDTGVIVNQGKALYEFKGLASTPNLPLTPNEEKGYGETSQSSIRGISWRIAPIEIIGLEDKASGYGRKSLPLFSREGKTLAGVPKQLMLGFFALNPEAFVDTKDGEKLPVVRIPLDGVVDSLTKLTPATGKANHLMPGTK